MSVSEGLLGATFLVALISALGGWVQRTSLFDKVEKILVQTTKTNGRVDAAEARIDEHTKEIETLREKVSKPATRRK